MSARDRILDRLRQAGAGRELTGTSADSPETVPANVMSDDRQTLIRVFVQRAEQSGANVQVLESEDALNDALASLSRETPLAIADRQLRTEFPELAATDSDASGALVRADAGIAETGTVCLHSGQLPSRSLFLCEHLVVLIGSADLLRYQEDYWRGQPETVPRAVHLITGPSRTADVEQTLQIGAHGPRTVTILLTASGI